MKRLIFTLLWAVPLSAQPLSPIQTAVLNDDAAAVALLAAQGSDWLFASKPTQTSEGELLLDFALANNKLAAYNALITQGVLPGISTVFTAVKSRNYILARQLVDAGNLFVYAEVEPAVPRYIISNHIETNIFAVFATNVFTNISQFAITNALGQLSLREYTNMAVHYATNFFTNVTSRVITNSVDSLPKAVTLPAAPSVQYIPSTNITPSSITNYKDSIYTYLLTNALGESVERVITNIVPEVAQTLITNITRQAVTNTTPPATLPPPPPGYLLKPVTLNRLNYIDLARLAESQGSPQTASYFLEKAKALE